ncbi:hypothetical protein CRE_14718 [Caenorhabditis remanei]|uniref:Uncharacterized protein n=1 Tax=Caenorhabditis remanei TaxID=31234 RepID=E3M9Q5_CAERE|nr:hypothetical protein CRE_14718 [Caenorhabditis remanei]
MKLKKVTLFKILDKCKATTREALECSGIKMKKKELNKTPPNCTATRDCIPIGALSAYLINRWNVKNVFCMLNGRTKCE